MWSDEDRRGREREAEAKLAKIGSLLMIARRMWGAGLFCLLDDLVAIWAMNVQKPGAGDPTETLDWLVYRVSGPNVKLLGTVIAPTLEAALAAAFREFNVTPTGRKRIIVRRTIPA